MVEGLAILHPDVAGLCPPELLESLSERCEAVALHMRHQHANPPHAVRLLGAGSKRPCRCASEQRDEIPPSHTRAHHGRPSSGPAVATTAGYQVLLGFQS